MREILFRGIAVSHGCFEFGDLITSMGKTYIGNTLGNHTDNWCEVIPETVGQYTGLTDKNGVKIFEGDIVLTKNDIGEEFKDVVEWYKKDSSFRIAKCYSFDYGKVIGNIHDNPELLK